MADDKFTIQKHRESIRNVLRSKTGIRRILPKVRNLFGRKGNGTANR